MGNKVTCTCGHSWNKSDSSKKDATVCHICGKDNEMKNGGWLDKYEQGGMVLKQKTNDNYGKKDNPNDVEVSVGDDYVGLAYDTTGRNYSPAWGGQFKYGGEIQQAQTGISFLPEQDPEMIYRNKFNTELNKEEQKEFNEWITKESKRQGRDILMDKGAYDVQGFWKSGDYKNIDEDNHGSDKWKKPNHPTFSNQSKYHGVDGFYGGNWTKEAGYQPSKQTAAMYSPDYYKWMFGREPNRPERLDNSRFESGVNTPSPLYYAMGGTIPGSVGFTYARTGDTPSEGPYAKKTLPSAQNGKEMQYYQEGLDFKPKNISRNGGWLDAYDVPKAEDGIETDCPVGYYKDANGNCVSLTSRNQQQAVSESSRIPQRDYELESKVKVRNAIANQPQFNQGRALTPYEEAVNAQRNKNYVQKTPNAQLVDGEIRQRNIDRSLEGKPLTALGRKQDASLERTMNVLEGVSAVTGVGSIASNALRLGAGALNKAIGRNAVSRGLRNFTSRVNPALNTLDEAAAYVQLDPIGIMGNRLNADFYNPSVALNTVNNTLTGVERNLKNSAIESSDIILGESALENAMDFTKPTSMSSNSVNVYEDYFKNIQANDERLQTLLASKKITYDNYLKESYLYKEELQKGLGLGEKLGNGTYGEVFELANDPSKAIKLGSPYGNKWTPELIENLKFVKQNANIAIPEQVEYFEIPSLYQGYKPTTKEVITMPNLNQVAAENLNLNKRDRYALFLKQARQLRDQGIKLDVANPENFKFNKDKGIFDIYDVNPGYINNPAAYMRYIKDKTQRRLLDDMMYKKGGIIKDDRGQWAHPGEITQINSPYITMEGVPYPVLGIADTGEEQMMYPGQDYEFEGAEYVTEYPKGKRPKKAKNGVNQADENSLVQLDQLTNFTNYNKPTKGGWLDKY